MTSTVLFRFLLLLLIAAATNLPVRTETAFIDKDYPGPPVRLEAPRISAADLRAELERRRQNVFDEMSDSSLLILFSADGKTYSNDVKYQYRQENNFFYLTGLRQPGATLVLYKKGPERKTVLFLPKRIPQFEVWNGRKYSREEATEISGIGTIVEAVRQNEFLTALRDKKPFAPTMTAAPDISLPNDVEKIYLLSDGRDFRTREFRKESGFAKTLNNHQVINVQPIFARLRLVKSPLEIRLIQHAVDITAEAAKRAMRTAGDAGWEYQVRAEIEYVFRRNNADFWGFPSIVGAGANTTTLHYEDAQAPLRPGQLLLTDIGAEYKNYSADITRTFPIGGKFSREQADIYRIVYRAQNEVARAAKPGTTLVQLNRVAAESVKKDLAELGLITAPDATYQGFNREVEQYRLWYLHFFGHWLGMDVHDVGSINSPLRPGMIFTNEPGVYIRADALDRVPDTPANREFLKKIRPAFEKYKNIGVRIEDDLLVTENGVQWMSGKLPRSIAEIESFMGKTAE